MQKFYSDFKPFADNRKGCVEDGNRFCVVNELKNARSARDFINSLIRNRYRFPGWKFNEKYLMNEFEQHEVIDKPIQQPEKPEILVPEPEKPEPLVPESEKPEIPVEEPPKEESIIEKPTKRFLVMDDAVDLFQELKSQIDSRCFGPDSGKNVALVIVSTGRLSSDFKKYGDDTEDPVKRYGPDNIVVIAFQPIFQSLGTIINDVEVEIDGKLEKLSVVVVKYEVGTRKLAVLENQPAYTKINRIMIDDERKKSEQVSAPTIMYQGVPRAVKEAIKPFINTNDNPNTWVAYVMYAKESFNDDFKPDAFRLALSKHPRDRNFFIIVATTNQNIENFDFQFEGFTYPVVTIYLKESRGRFSYIEKNDENELNILDIEEKLNPEEAKLSKKVFDQTGRWANILQQYIPTNPHSLGYIIETDLNKGILGAIDRDMFEKIVRQDPIERVFVIAMIDDRLLPPTKTLSTLIKMTIDGFERQFAVVTLRYAEMRGSRSLVQDKTNKDNLSFMKMHFLAKTAT